MKKVSAILVLMVALVFAASAVSAQGMMEKMSFGVKGGLSLAKGYGDDSAMGTVDASFRMAGIFGAFMNYEISEMFAIQPEVLYAMKGNKWEEGDAKIIFQMDYVDIALLGKVLIPMEGMVKPNIYVGPYVAFNIKEDYKAVAGDEEETGSIEEGFGVTTKGTDFGLVVGAGADFAVGEVGSIIIDIRFEMGFVNLFDPPEGEEDIEFKNQALFFMAGFGF
ncbi:MAG: PorT family protein [bacterium]|nr:MAG: PorT family protein [bacterium]